MHPTVPAESAASVSTGAFCRASTNEEEVWTDRRKPQAQIACAYAGLQEYGSTGAISVKTLPVVFSIRFSEAVSGFDADSVGIGGTTTLQSPSHVYANAGTYTVSLTVTTAKGTDTATGQAYVRVYTGMPALGTAGLALALTLLGLCGMLVLGAGPRRSGRTKGERG